MWRHIIAGLILAGTFLPVADHAYAQTRTPTGVTGQRDFDQGARLAGADISYADGSYAVNVPCYLARAEAPGTVRNGVINPWPEEIRGYPACEFVSPVEAVQAAPSGATSQRRPTGVTGELQFDVGESAAGVTLTYIDGWYADGPCVLSPTEAPGSVRNGVVNPWPEETRGFPACSFQPPVMVQSPSAGAPTAQRRPSGVTGEMNINPGESAAGVNIAIDGLTATNGPCYVERAAAPGSVRNGVVNYWPDEIRGFPACAFAPIAPPPGYGGPPASGYGQSYGGPPPSTEKPTVNGRPRIPTGRDGIRTFQPGDAAQGSEVVIDGVRYTDGCLLLNAGISGFVRDGVINPWVDEARAPCGAAPPQLIGQPPILPGYQSPIYPQPGYQPGYPTYSGQPAGGQRLETGKSGTLRFSQGDPVSGFRITLDNGVVLTNCFLPSAMTSGSVQDGVIRPNADEAARMNRC